LGGLIENNHIREMSKQHILPRKKFALWLAYKGICYYCKEPVDYKDIWIDHILPEHLLKTPEKLKQILQEYELDSDFDVEDYCNWIPAHWRCNLEKGGTIFDKGTARYYINIAKGKVTTAQEEEQRVIRDLKRGKLLGSLEIALSEGLLSKQALITILKQEPTPKARIEPTIITFGLNYYDLWESKLRPDWLNDYDPSDYPFVCDLLEKDLVRIMGRKNLPGRPLIYGTTKKFLEVFGLKDLESLPKLKEFKALGGQDETQSNQEEIPFQNESREDLFEQETP